MSPTTTQSGIAPYAGPNSSAGGTPTPGPSVGTGGTTKGTEGTNLLLTPPTNNPNQIPSLDPSIAGKVVSIAPGGTGSIVPTTQTKSAIGHINEAMEMRKLLIAYQDLYSPTVVMTGEDVRVLKGLGNKRINRFIDAYQASGATGSTPGSWIRSGAQGPSPSGIGILSPSALKQELSPSMIATDLGIGGGSPSKKALADAVRRQAGFSDPNVLKKELTEAIAKKVPGLNPKALSDPNNVLDLQVPQALLTKWSDVSSSLTAGMTFNDLYTPFKDVAGNVRPAIMTPQAVKAEQKNLVSAASKLDTGAQSAESAYQGLVKEYNDPANQSAMISTLENAGLLMPGANNATPEPTQVYSALANLVTQAANTGQPVQSVVNSGYSSLNTAGVNAASVGEQASWVAAAKTNYGVNLSPEQETGLVTKAIQGGWTQPQIDQAVSSMFTYTPGQQLTGRAANIWSGMQTLQQEYLPGLPLSEDAKGKWLTQAITGAAAGATANPLDASGDVSGTSSATAAYKQYVQGQAASMFPQFANQINTGITTKTLIDPYAQLAATLLGFGNVSGSGQASVSQAQDATAQLGINWQDPKWSKLIAPQANPETGKMEVPSLDQARTTIITDPVYGWQNTSMASNLGSHVADELLQTFGFYKPGGT